MKNLQNLLEKKYRSPERYRLTPEGKIIQPFGIDMTENKFSFNRGIYFGKKDTLALELYSPLEADWWEFDFSNRILYLRDTELDIELRIYGIRPLSLSRRESTEIHRGEPLGTAFKIESLKPLVYVESIITSKIMQDAFRGRFLTSEDDLDIRKAYIKSWSQITDQKFLFCQKQMNQYRYENRISEINPYWVSLRSCLKHPAGFYFNYSTLFC